MKAKKVEKAAKKLDPKGFSEWLRDNEVKHRVHDANLRDHNDGWYIVELEVEEGKLEVCYLDGEFEEADIKID